ncbi:broad substrate specificity ATP-binding cassette transporter ABCG2-like isoform 4-T8 [Amazona ochrocephala]
MGFCAFGDYWMSSSADIHPFGNFAHVRIGVVCVELSFPKHFLQESLLACLLPCIFLCSFSQQMGTAQNNSSLKKLHAAELDRRNRDMMADTSDHSIISVGGEEEMGNFQRSLPTRESLRSPRGSVVSFHNIQYSVKQSSGFLCKRKTVEKKILHNVYGIMKPGLNAILGPTGSGKSSLLDVLAARKDPAGLSGEVLIDGIPQPPNFKCISGYVVQDDVVMGTMTVRENLHFSAALRLPSSISVKEKEERVTQIISELGLSKVADAKVGTELIRGVSGGERKRTNIGMELITEPPVLFLDEPTTGLDASTANAVLILLKNLSRRGRTIIFSIHQPRYSIFKLFDSLTLLALGKVLYHGPAKQALEYFSSIGYECEPFNNPADFFLDIINGDSTAVAASKKDHSPEDTGKEVSSENGVAEGNVDSSVVDVLHQKYLKSSLYESTKEALGNVELGRGSKQKASKHGHEITYANGFLTQLYWVSKRSLKNLIRNPQASVAQIAVTIILALVVGAIFFGVKLDRSGIQNRVGSLFFVTTNQCFSSVSAIELFIRDKKLFVIPSCCRPVLLLHAEPDAGVLHCHSHVSGYQCWDGCGGCGQPAHHYLFCPHAYFLRPPSKPPFCNGLAELAQVLQHSPIWTHCSSSE